MAQQPTVAAHVTSPNPSFLFVFLGFLILVWVWEGLGCGGAQKAPPHLTALSIDQQIPFPAISEF